MTQEKIEKGIFLQKEIEKCKERDRLLSYRPGVYTQLFGIDNAVITGIPDELYNAFVQSVINWNKRTLESLEQEFKKL